MLPVSIVKNSETPLSSIRLRTCTSCEGPGMLSFPHIIGLSVQPAQGSRISANLSSDPGVRRTITADQSQEVICLLSWVQRHKLHPLGPTEGNALGPGKVAPPISPGQEEVLSAPLIVSLGSSRCWRCSGGWDGVGEGGRRADTEPQGLRRTGLKLLGLKGLGLELLGSEGLGLEGRLSSEPGSLVASEEDELGASKWEKEREGEKVTHPGYFSEWLPALLTLSYILVGCGRLRR